MAYKKLSLDWDKINTCREIASKVVKPVQRYVDRHSSLSIESASLFLAGAQDISESKPISDLIITKIEREKIRRGALYWFGQGLVHTKLPPKVLGLKIIKKKISLNDIPEAPFESVRQVISKHVLEGIKKFKDLGTEKGEAQTFGQKTPLIMTIKDKRADLRDLSSEAGGPHDIILCKNPKILNPHLERITGENFRPKKLAFSLSGLEKPQQAVKAALLGIDIFSSNLLKDILIENINLKRTFVDTHWTSRLCSKREKIFYSQNTDIAEIDPYREAHQILVSQLINEKLAENAGLIVDLFAIDHSFELDPLMEDGFIHELARAALIREIYPRSNIIYYYPATAKGENPIESSRVNAIFNLAAAITEQSIAVTVPFTGRNEGAKASSLTFNNTKSLGNEIQFNPNGKIARRAHVILENTFKTLQKLEQTGFINAISQGLMFGIKKNEKEGAGLDGVFQKDRSYFNPIEDLLEKKP